jgi:hypothetical protein
MRQKMSNKETYRSVCLSVENFRRLCELGTVPDSMNRIVGRLIDQHYEVLKEKNNFAGEAAIIQE